MKDKRRPGLGRGMAALLEEWSPAVTVDEAGRAENAAGGALFLPLSRVRANPLQPRRHFAKTDIDELIESVRTHGILQPILVREKGDDYEIIAGERRWRAAQAAELDEIPVIIKSFDDATGFELALVENIQRADLNPIEEAAAYRRLIQEFDHSHETIATTVGKSRSHVSNMLRLLELPAPVQEFVIAGSLSMGHARALLGAEDPLSLAQRVIDDRLSVRQVEALISGTRAGKTPRKGKKDASTSADVPEAAPQSDPDTMALEMRLSEALGMSVSIVEQGQEGDLRVSYRSLEELDRLVQRLMQTPLV